MDSPRHRSQPVAGFCHHGLRSTQVVAFLLRRGPALAYKLAGSGQAGSIDPERLTIGR